MNLIADIASGLFWMTLVMIGGFIVVIALMSLIGKGSTADF